MRPLNNAIEPNNINIIKGIDIDLENKLSLKDFDKLKNLSARETAELQNQLEAKNNELQIKEDALLKLDQELKEKQRLLIEREKRVNELEEAIRKKEAAVQLLKAKVANALRGFENQGLSVVQKNGKQNGPVVFLDH